MPKLKLRLHQNHSSALYMKILGPTINQEPAPPLHIITIHWVYIYIYYIIKPKNSHTITVTKSRHYFHFKEHKCVKLEPIAIYLKYIPKVLL